MDLTIEIYMKFKIIDNEKMLFAGVVDYNNNLKNKSSNTSYHMDFDLNFDEETLDKITDNAMKFQDSLLESLSDIIDKNDLDNEDLYDEEDPNKKDYENNNSSGNFEENMERFAKKMEKFGEEMERYGSKFAQKMERFGNNMEKWGSNLEKDIEKMASKWEKSWSTVWDEDDLEDEEAVDAFSSLSLYKSLYENHIKGKPYEFNSDNYYEIQIMNLDNSENTSCVFLGSRITSFKSLPYQLNLMQFNPDKWLVIKCDKEEYEKDWINRLEKSDTLKEYILGDYFIVRHGHENKYNKIKLYYPLMVKNYD